MRYRYGRWTKGKGLFDQVATMLLKEQRLGSPKIQFHKAQEFLFFACIHLREPA
jgi:hypothetical protein